MTGEYNADSKSILNEIGVHNDEDDDADDDVAHYDEELLEVEEKYRGDEEDKSYSFREIVYIFIKKK